MNTPDIEMILTQLDAIDGESREHIARKRREAVTAWLAEKPKPAPEPTYLERLPEKLRPHLTEDQARMVWESRDETFAAGEPTESVAFISQSGRRVWVHSDFNSGATIRTDLDYNLNRSLCKDNTIRLARRLAAISLREGGAA